MYPYSADTDALMPVTAFRRCRLLWVLCAFTLLLLPGTRSQPGASPLKGQSGGYTGHGNWQITATYSGNASVTTQPNGATNGTASGAIGDRYFTTNGSYDLSRAVNVPPYTETGGITAKLHNTINIGTTNGNPDM